MAARIRNDIWKGDETLSDAIKLYVKQNFKRKELLDFLKRDFNPIYAGSKIA